MRSLRAWVLFVFTSAAVGIAAGPGCGGGGGAGTGPGTGLTDGSTGGDDGTTVGNNDGGSLLNKDGGLTDAGGTCKPRTCSQLKPPVGCGSAGDGCGGVIQCGSCKAPETCGGGDPEAGKPGVPGQCGGTQGCVPKTCADYPSACGPQSDGCGGLTTNCNTPCPTGQTCGGDPAKPGECGTPPVVCTPWTCGHYPSGTCGTQSDGCGGLTANCNPCTAPATCGGGGVPDQCGIAPTSDASLCTPITSCPAGTCGVISNGCGGTVACATTCTAPQTCGGGGTPGQCGSAGSTCTPLTCAQACANAGITTGCCGQFSDGCGGLTASCGGCVPPAICGGGGTASQCGDSNLDGGTVTCTGLCGQIPTCSGGTNTTTVTGRVYAGTDPVAGYGAPDPIQHAHVFIPNDPTSLTQFGAQVACACDSASGPAIASTYSAIDGSFTLTNVPAGSNIPIVIQLGRWRRVYYTNITACVAAPAPGTTGTNSITDDTACRAGNTCNTRMPRVEHEFNQFDNIPLIAEDTGSADSMECVLPKIGIDGAGVAAWMAGGAASTQYTDPGGGGRVIFYKGNGAILDGLTPAEGTLVGSATTLEGYDMVVFDCEGGVHTKTATQLSNVQTYANAGGRVFGTHYGYVWAYTNVDWGCGVNCTTSGKTVADWSGDNYDIPDPVTATVDNATMLAWLRQPLVGPVIAGTGTTISVNTPRDNLSYVIPPNGSGIPATQQYLHSAQYGSCAASGCPLEFTFNTDPYGTAAQQCGRVLFSDFHVYGGAGSTFPAECSIAPLTAQEKVLEFEIFDLGDCVQAITPPPPPMCTPKTCANYPAGTCGDQSDGCGGFVQCLTCPVGQSCVNSQCVSNTCTPLTCSNYPSGTCGQQSDGCGGLTTSCGACSSCTLFTCANYPPGTCGTQSDGCGGTIQCLTCPSGQTCGGGGTPNQCGTNEAGTCVPSTCQTGQCGTLGDGCGGTITCSCPTGQTCGGGGTPGVCGATSCTKLTCTQACSNVGVTTGCCGQFSDGCGGTMTCGTCTSPQTCGGGGTPNQCGAPSCTPLTCTKTCAAAGITTGCCGQFSDGCGGLTTSCGACTSPQTCGGGGVANQCGGGSAQ